MSLDATNWRELTAETVVNRLISLGLYLNSPECAIICTRCQYALQPAGEAVSKQSLGQTQGTIEPASGSELIHEILMHSPPDQTDRHCTHTYLYSLGSAASIADTQQ
jgi:hypothetical protein